MPIGERKEGTCHNQHTYLIF